MPTVHAKPDYRILPLGDPPPGYPAEAHPDTYHAGPVESTFRQRREAFIAYVMQNPAPQNTKPVWFELLRLIGGGQAHEGVIHGALDYIDSRKDCADFVHHSILRMLYQFDPRRPSPNPALPRLEIAHPLSVEVLDRAKQTTLGFKYFPAEPGIDSMCSWTENHYILFTAAGYLAGQLYPDEVFTNSGETGREKMAQNKPRILRWMDMRFLSGFNEWLSHIYYDEDLTALLSLLDFCEDQEIRAKAGILIDLMLLDVALNSFKGMFAATHGRSYENAKKWPSQESTNAMSKLLFGQGIYSGFDNMTAPALVMSSYHLPAAIAAIAADGEASYVNRQRVGFHVDDVETWGWDYDDIETGMLLLTNEAYLHPRTARLTLDMFDAFNWWHNAFFADFRPYRGFLNVMRRLGLMGTLARLLEKDVARNMRGEPNLYTYKTPDFMLSTAQDHRAGFGGDQHSIWQATLGPEAVCFTTHPARIGGASPNYWEGSGILPRAAQHRNLAIIVYRLRRIFPALYVPIEHFYTHAWLPKDRFDEVVERDGWVFVRKARGYLALRSMQPYFWHTADYHPTGITIRKEPEDFDREIIAPGKDNIWICQMGREAEDGSFAAFVESILAADLAYDGLSVRFDSPGNGVVRFGWEGPLTLDGQVIPLHDYPRYDNPYVQAEFHPRDVAVSAGDHRLRVNWNPPERITS